MDNPPVDYRLLMKRVEEVVDVIEQDEHDEEPLIHQVVGTIIDRLRDDLGIYAARVYSRVGDSYVLRAAFPGEQDVEIGFRVPRRYRPIELCLLMGVVYMEPSDPRIDPELEAAIGVKEFAAIEVAGSEYVLGFSVAPGYDREGIIASLGVVRRAINERIRRGRVEVVLEQANQIQASILPPSSPVYAHYLIAARHESVDSMGGDLFDFIEISDKILGLVIADASGHGLPAALQVRDVHVGLRMGVSRDFKMVRTLERLNKIIHANSLSSRFVSLVYGELEESGAFIYTNAGHPPPLHVAAGGRVKKLVHGGPIVGALPNATYGRGIVHMQPGDTLVLYTDGITEALREGDTTGRDEYGPDRIVDVVKAHQGKTAGEIADAILASVKDWMGDTPQTDDRTLIVIVHPGQAE